jgi:hypothetical protein
VLQVLIFVRSPLESRAQKPGLYGGKGEKMVAYGPAWQGFVWVLLLPFFFAGACGSSKDKAMSTQGKSANEAFRANSLVTQGTIENRELPRTEPFRPESLVPSLSSRPNILFVLMDDLSVWDLEAMPRLKSLITDQETSFLNFFVNLSQCLPSRASLLRGQYAHNTKIYGNYPPEGGFEKFHDSGKEISTIAVWLRDAGYRRMLVGKY